MSDPSPLPPTPVTPTQWRQLLTSTIVIAVILVGAALFWLRPVLVPFVLALFVVIGITPILELVEQRFKAPRTLAVAITLVAGIAIVALLWWMVWVSISNLLTNIDSYHDRFREVLNRVAHLIPAELIDPSVPGDPGPADPATLPDAAPSPASPEPPPGSASQREQQLSEFLGRNLRQTLINFSSALLESLSNGIVVLIFVFFLLLGESATRPVQGRMWRDIESQVRRYLVTKSVISLLTGALFGVILWIFGVPLAMVFGLLAVLLNFIPNIGPIVASLLPLPLIILAPDLPLWKAVLVIGLSWGVQFASGSVIEPKIMGESFDMHPVVILLTLIFWGMLWGIVGMFLATPITAAILIVLNRFPSTQPVARLLSGHVEMLEA